MVILKHIGLQIIEEDLDEFYTQVFKGRVNHSFDLDKESAEKIFDIRSNVQITYLTIDQVEFELFIHKEHHSKNFNHICLMLDNAEKIYDKAEKCGYLTYKRTGKFHTTYFIKDRAGNIFELKGFNK